MSSMLAEVVGGQVYVAVVEGKSATLLRHRLTAERVLVPGDSARISLVDGINP